MIFGTVQPDTFPCLCASSSLRLPSFLSPPWLSISFLTLAFHFLYKAFLFISIPRLSFHFLYSNWYVALSEKLNNFDIVSGSGVSFFCKELFTAGPILPTWNSKNVARPRLLCSIVLQCGVHPAVQVLQLRARIHEQVYYTLHRPCSNVEITKDSHTMLGF